MCPRFATVSDNKRPMNHSASDVYQQAGQIYTVLRSSCETQHRTHLHNSRIGDHSNKEELSLSPQELRHLVKANIQYTLTFPLCA
jgi:hypothetical protein